jgi:hypothetical protein
MARLVRLQHGPVGRGQLVELGLSERRIDYAIADGRYFVVHPGVYLIGNRDLSDLGSLSAAVLACGDGAVLGVRNGGQLRGVLTGFQMPIEVLVPRLDAPKIEGIHARKAILHPYETGSRHNIPVTSLAGRCSTWRRSSS